MSADSVMLRQKYKQLLEKNRKLKDKEPKNGMDQTASYEVMEPKPGDIEQLMIEKAHDLFQACDTEEKGFINKRDMQRLRLELPLTPEQLEDVFDSLDDDKNGFLTLEEFTNGFGSFLGMKPNYQAEEGEEITGDVYDEVYEEDEDGNISKQFDDMMEQVGASKILPHDDTIKALWVKLQKDEPGLLDYYEEFLAKVSQDIKKSQTDCDDLEHALKLKSVTHDAEIKKLYEEMEFQIKTEKDRILTEEKAKEKSLRTTMELEIQEKERLYQEMLAKQQDMETRLEEMNNLEVQTKEENERLLKERESLENMLYESQESLQESQSYINHLSGQFKDDKRQRAFAALKLSEGIALERESLVKQLDTLRDVNTRLRDDRDEAEQCEARHRQNLRDQSKVNGRAPFLPTTFQSEAKFPSTGHSTESLRGRSLEDYEEDIEEDIECDDDDPELYITQPHNHSDLHSNPQNGSHNFSISDSVGDSISDSISDSHKSHPYNRSKKHVSGDSFSSDPESEIALHRSAVMALGSIEEISPDDRPLLDPKRSSTLSEPIHRERDQPLGAAAEQLDAIDAVKFVRPKGPERVFKVVFVGDSGVGKSSFIHRFCNDSFREKFAATIGVDFQIKTVEQEGHLIALQLWDTAGQERFRSITKQYFRKADGVVIMYDITSENSFKNIRNWMLSVQEGVDDGTVLVIVGNKSDLMEGKNKGVVSTKSGTKLADEYGALFYETSSKSGDGIPETIDGLTSLLREKEDKAIQDALRLDNLNLVHKKKCCGK